MSLQLSCILNVPKYDSIKGCAVDEKKIIIKYDW